MLPGGICHPGLHSLKYRMIRTVLVGLNTPGRDGRGGAELRLALLSQRQVLSLGSHLFGASSWELSDGAGKGRVGLRP